MRAVAITHIQAKPGIIRHDIRCHPGALVDVMEPRSWLNMFAHQVDAMSEDFCRMYSAPPKPGAPRSMCAFPEELDLQLVDGGRSVGTDLGNRTRMPMQSDVKIIEQPCAGHIDLGSFGLLGRTSI